MCDKIADRHYDLSRHPSASPSRWYRREQRRLDNRVHSNTSNIQLGEARRGLSSLRCAYLYLFSRFSYSITILHLISLFGLGSLNCLLPPVGGKQLKHLAAWVQGCRVRCARYMQRKYETSLGQIFIQLSVWCKHGLGRTVGVSKWMVSRAIGLNDVASWERESENNLTLIQVFSQ